MARLLHRHGETVVELNDSGLTLSLFALCFYMFVAVCSESCLGWVHACQPLHGGPRGDLDEAAVGGGGWQLQPLAGLVGP